MTENEELPRTKMCKSVEDGRKCINGEKCRFAHKTEQLSIKDCIFRERCTFVKCQTDNEVVIYINNNIKQKVCQYLHPNETIENYLSRMKMTRSTPMPSLLRNTRETFGFNSSSGEKSQENQTWSQVVRKTVKNSKLNIVELSDCSDENERETENASNNEIVVKVPREAVESALKAIIESGKSNIRLEIVDF